MTAAPEFLGLQAALAGEYSLQRELGRGGMGIVYLARDVQLDRDVAIKVLPALMARDASARDWFLKEARLAAGLSHPHIVPIHRVGEADGFVFFVMSYVEGETLGERLRRAGPLPPAEATRMLREVAWALAYAHGRGIIHRDVKPDNILLEAATGRALVTDFGIAHRGLDSENPNEPRKIRGTPHFMSPEQVSGDQLDGRSDLYALGVVGYLAVSGRLPFETTEMPALMLQQATLDPPGVGAVAPGLPAALGSAIDICLNRDPDDRFQDGEALAEALVPAGETRPALPPTLRSWLAAKNPLLIPYMLWSGVFTIATLGNYFGGNRTRDVIILAVIASLPIWPIIGFHLNQAWRQFKAGHTLADLRAALEVSRRERAETDAAGEEEREPAGHRILRGATVAAGTWLASTFALVMFGIIHERNLTPLMILTPVGFTLLFGALSNTFNVQFVPKSIQRGFQSGIRERIWRSKLGEWIAKKLGAPERSMLAGASAFRATEAALGVAAGELYQALPKAYREQLTELPAMVAALEARAAEARAELEMLNAMASSETGARVVAGRKQQASAHLAESVAALEGIRLDLLRLHAGANDLAPLTTLIDAARHMGEDMHRLADAQLDVERTAG